MAKYYQDFVGLNTFVYEPHWTGGSGRGESLILNTFLQDLIGINFSAERLSNGVAIATYQNTKGSFDSNPPYTDPLPLSGQMQPL